MGLFVFQEFLPATIMFLITIGFTSILISPAKAFPRKNELANFYWTGCWTFLSFIAALSGASSTLMLLGFDPTHFMTHAIMSAAVASFVCFVVFGWFRLSGAALMVLIRKYAFKTSKTT